MNCCKNLCNRLTVTDITVSGDTTVITCDDAPIYPCNTYILPINTYVPPDSACTQIIVAINSVKVAIMNNLKGGDYWRNKSGLQCGTELVVKYYSDPEHFNICTVRNVCL